MVSHASGSGLLRSRFRRFALNPNTTGIYKSAAVLGRRGRESGRGRKRLAKLNHAIQRVSEFFNTRHGNNDRIAATADFLHNSQKTASWILTEIECDLLSLNPDAAASKLRSKACGDLSPRPVAIRAIGFIKTRMLIRHVVAS